MKLLKVVLPTALALILLTLSLSVAAAVFSDGIDCYFDEETSTLYIIGSGDMDDFENEYASSWRTYSNTAKRIVIEDGVNSVGANAFAGFYYLDEVIFADSVNSIGSSAFASCPHLKVLTLSSNITSIADTSFSFDKSDFKLNVEAGSYALFYSVKNNVSFNCDAIELSDLKSKISSYGMHAYYPIRTNHDCTVTFESVGNYDTKCFIYDFNFKKLANNDNGGENYNFKITYSFKAGETYYFDALMWSTGDKGTFDVSINVDSFDYNVCAYAMADPSGAASGILIDELLIEGKKIEDGITLRFNESPAPVDITFNGKTSEIFVTPNSDNTLVLPTCDINNDGYVNAKDFAELKKENSKYLPLFDRFINYRL